MALMSLLVRKIERAKWMQNDVLGREDVSADAITNCMKTKANALSVWEVTEEGNVPDAVLAIASEFQHLDTIDVVILHQAAIADAGLHVEKTEGRTPVKELLETHRDITNLGYSSLGTLAGFIVDGFRDDRVKRFTRGQIRRLIKEAIESGRLDKEELQKAVRSKI